MFKINVYGATDTGKVRDRNEDSVYLDEESGVYGVADGLGGLPYGELASKIATELIGQELGREGWSMEEAFYVVNDAVIVKGRELGEELGIATTLTVVKVEGGRLYCGHVGDTGLILVEGDDAKQLTHDDTMAQQFRDEAPGGLDMKIPDMYNHILSQCIGGVKKLRVQQVEMELRVGQRYLLYSDGVTKTHTFEEVVEVMRAAETPKEAVERLIVQANEKEGPDNITALVIYVV